jgi:hypothetical protein
MPEKSIFEPGGDRGMHGGLDRFLGPPAREYSHMPPALDEDKVQPDEAEGKLDCAGKDADESVCEIARAEEEEREMGSEGT